MLVVRHHPDLDVVVVKELKGTPRILAQKQIGAF